MKIRLLNEQKMKCSNNVVSLEQLKTFKALFRLEFSL